MTPFLATVLLFLLETPAVWPGEVVLVGPNASHEVLSPAELVSADPSVARVDGRRVVAVSDGTTVVRTAGTAVRVLVRDVSKPRSFDFTNEILPILTRAGCNAATCHGAALGQAGFKLSLFGEDPEADHLAITHDLAGRRIDRGDPRRSLILRKPTRDLPHKGGRRFEEGSDAHRSILAWAERGFPFREDDLRVEKLEVGGSSRLLARAWYSDGAARDVTRLALFSSQDDGVAAVSQDGEVTLKGPGEAAIMVRFAGHVAAARVSKPYAARPGRSGSPADRQQVPGSFVDEHVDRALERLGLTPSPESDAATFLRRAHLGIIGTLPPADEIRGFLAAPDRAALIDGLIARPEFDDYWAYRLDQVFGVSSRRMGGREAAAFHAWLRSRVRMPWRETANTVLRAGGVTPETGFYRVAGGDPKLMVEEVGRVFLGSRWQCSQCHNHPFERFRQLDYFGLAAMFARVRLTDQGVVAIARGEIVFPRTGKPASPAFPDGSPGDVDGDRRARMADWVISRPQLAQAFANRVWALLMGRGLVQPPDDFRSSNPPSHPELLDELARLETIPELVRAIALSAAYGRAGAEEWNRADDRFYSHARVKRLDAEVLLDAISRSTGVPDAFEDRPGGTRAIALGDLAVPSYTLDVCGRGRPDFTGSLGQALHLLNGDAIQPKLSGVAPLLILHDEDLISELYLRTLSRLPSPREREHWRGALASAPRDEAAEDLLWALLNSREFTTCH